VNHLEHLSAENMAALVDRRLSVAARRIAEAHLADCHTCREEFVAVQRLVRSSRRLRRSLMIALPLGAAAALAFMWIRFDSVPQVTNPPSTLRGAPEGMIEIAAVSPLNGTQVRADSVALIWRDVGDGVRYQVNLSTSDGSQVFSEATPDTLLRVRVTDQRLHAGTYFWYVDALLADGRTATTGVQRFEVMR
jgi:hypothetical protein